MERQIEALDERLHDDPRWIQAKERLDETLLSANLKTAKELFYFFAFEENASGRTLEMAWLSLESQILNFLREVDFTGVSQVLGEVAPEYLAQFSFTNATEFRRTEEALLNDLEIPQEAWNRFWSLADEKKGKWLSQVSQLREQAPYSAYLHLAPSVIDQFAEGPGSYEIFHHLDGGSQLWPE
jgi:hypothetical protein